MKTFAGTLTALLLLCAAPAFAQTAEEIELARAVAATERKLLVAKNMQFNEKESEDFWPLYNEYQEKVWKVNDRIAKLVTGYAKDFEALSNEDAKQMLDQFQDIEEERLKLRKSYVKKFYKVLPAKKVARFYQIENKLDAIINIQLARAIPLVE
jgi:hypothetical protein